MVILFHVLIALSSVGYTTYLFVSPAKSKFPVAYALVALTLISGTYLVLTMPAHMVQACTTGLIYIAAVSVGIVAAQKKLARITRISR